MGIKVQQNVVGSPRMEVGEIDTSAPFKSVKAAVSMFGESAFSQYKPAMRKLKSESSGRIFAKETQLHLAQKELNKYKEQLKNCDRTRTIALAELDKAKRIVSNLTEKLNTIYQSKENAIKVTETAKLRGTERQDCYDSSSQDLDSGLWKQELNNATEQYAIADAELDSAKQDLRRLKRELETCMDVKTIAIQKEQEAKHLIDINSDQAKLLSKDIAAVKGSMSVKFASVLGKKEESKFLADKDALWQSYRIALEETERKLASLKEEFPSELIGDLESKLAEKSTEIGLLQKEMENARASDLDSITTARTELNHANEVLKKVVEEENYLIVLFESLGLEPETVKREHLELKKKEAENESLAGNLHVKIQERKSELEMNISRETKTKVALDDLMSTLKQLSSKSETERKSVETLRADAEVQMEEAKAAQISLKEEEEKAFAASRELEETKNAEADAQNQVNLVTDRTDLAWKPTSESGFNVTISREEFESLRRKPEESKMLSDIKVAAVMAQMEAVKASENEATKKLEAVRGEMEKIESATQEALKSATMSEAARMAIEGEVKMLHEREQKREAAAASQKSHEVGTCIKPSPTKARAVKPNSISVRTMMQKTTTTKKTIILGFGGIKCLGQRSQPEVGSPSYVAGEKSGLLVLLD